MRILILILIGAIILFLYSIIYRQNITPILTDFPLKPIVENHENNFCINLILFFSLKTCQGCLGQIINYLNEPPKYIRVIGIIPNNELELIPEIRNKTRAIFPILGLKNWKRYSPNYVPTIYGVGPDGKIYFIIACTGIEKDFIEDYINEFKRKASYLLRCPTWEKEAN